MGTQPPRHKGAELPNFRLMSIVTKRLDGLRCHGGKPRPMRLCVRWGDPATPRKKGTPTPPNFWPIFYCDQTAGWMKTALGMEVDLGPGHIVLDGVPALRERDTVAPSFRPMSIVATVSHLSYC